MVHKATLDGVTVAVKVLRAEYCTNKAIVKMLVREANLLSKLEHA